MEKERNEALKKVKKYRRNLERRISDRMDMDEDARDSSSAAELCEDWQKIRKAEKCMEHCKLTPEVITAWVDGMKNADGSTGAHWTMEQTTTVAKSSGVMMSHVTQEEFWAAMNMMYSDYYAVADKFGTNKPDFFAELAKAFLWDKDGPAPEEKLAAYYWGIVENGD